MRRPITRADRLAARYIPQGHACIWTGADGSAIYHRDRETYAELLAFAGSSSKTFANRAYRRAVDRNKDSAEIRARLEAAHAHRTRQAAAKRSDGATPRAIIVAELIEDRSDPQTDYFGSRTVAEVLLATSTHTRDLFSELRAAAATFEPTAHLGPGLSRVTVSAVLAADAPGLCLYAGQCSPWNRDQRHTFRTMAEAQAWIAAQPPLVPVWDRGVEVPLRWEATDHGIEHREKYSMGLGYYLSASSGFVDGWIVRKCALPSDGTLPPTVAEWQARQATTAPAPEPEAPVYADADPAPAGAWTAADDAAFAEAFARWDRGA